MCSTEPTLMRVAEVAAFMRCTRRHVERLISDEKIPALKDGRRTLIRRSDVLRYLRSIRRK